MAVAYPRKLNNSISARDLAKQFVLSDRKIHLMTLNRYRYNEQRSCKELTDIIEKLKADSQELIELIQELSRHVSDEARHAMWLTDLLIDLGPLDPGKSLAVTIGTPLGVSYIDYFERLLELESYDPKRNLEDYLITVLASINVTEKRGCQTFAAHIHALKEAPQTEENSKIRETLEKIFLEEAGHVSWGNRWLAKIAKKSPECRKKVEQTKQKCAAMEQAAWVMGNDLMVGAELRRLKNLLEVTNTMPFWERPLYLMRHLLPTLLAPELQITRIRVAYKAWKLDPQMFREKLVPMFFNGLK
ncbi:MAG: ferritin-like domain-containing protein [Xenococcus sp. MO_188.B8]|nr:ferritin-like domain-containing protein [Xenococcus sp. MO_188.B8]